VLVIEVADSSLPFDRRDKGSLYARARIAEYWIVNLSDRVLEVYRDPAPDPAAPHGWRYRAMSGLRPPATVAPMALPLAQVRVGDLLG
jgi:Uma2 family endonuclease